MIYYIAGFILIIGALFRSIFYEKAFMILIGFVLYGLGTLKEISEQLDIISIYLKDLNILEKILENDKK